MITTTETLLEKLAAGNEARWARFYRDYAPFLETFLRKIKPELSAADAEEVVSETMIDIAKLMPTYTYDKAKKGAFHSLLYSIARNKACDRLRKLGQERGHLEKFAAEPFVISGEDWRRARYEAALRRVLADTTIQSSTKIVFRRVVQLGEPVETVAADLGLTANAIYQIRDRMKKRLAEEVEKLETEFPDEL